MFDWIPFVYEISQFLYKVFRKANITISEIFIRLKFKNYYIRKYVQEVTVLKNGHGIITCELNMKIFNLQERITVRRWFDISDGGPNATINHSGFSKSNGEKRFLESDFFYKAYIGGLDVTNKAVSIKQYPNMIYKDGEYQNVSKELINKVFSFEFVIDPAEFPKNSTEIKIMYCFSNPDMFDIVNQSENNVNTQISIEHKIRNLCHIISFENGLIVAKDSIQKCVKELAYQSDVRKKSNHKVQNSLYYNKYVISKRNPKYHSLISFCCRASVK